MSNFLFGENARWSVRGALGLAILLLAWSAPEVLRVGAFSEGAAENGLPRGWAALRLKDIGNRTTYTLVRADSTIVVKAVSEGGASGLVNRTTIDPAQYPVLEWRWKVEGVVEAGDPREKGGDDYAARVYVTFDYDPADLGFGDRLKYAGMKAMGYGDVPLRALNYTWAAAGLPVGKPFANPYTDWVTMLPVRSGTAEAGTWAAERRNVFDDYRAAFGEDPPPINGVAIMTDTDDTGSAATAYYGDIVFRAGEVAAQRER